MRESARLTQLGSNIGFYVSCDELRDFVSKELCGGNITVSCFTHAGSLGV
jgi:hypothetical protein